MEGTFSFETLSKQEALERKSPRLTKLDAGFFAGLRTYLELLEVSHRKEQERNPSGKKGQFLADELRNARRKAEALWEARERKISFLALKNARDEAAHNLMPENLTKEEAPFYEALLRTFRDQQQKVLPNLAAMEEPSVVSPRAAALAALPPLTASISASPEAPAPTNPVGAPASARPASEELQTIRALVDIPPFVGYEGQTYRIKKGDVVSLPKRFARILKDRGQVAVIS